MFTWFFGGGTFKVTVCIRSLCDLGYKRWSKTRVPGLPVGQNHMILGSLVLMRYQRVTDRRTDTPRIAKWRSGIAERDKISVCIGHCNFEIKNN